MTTLPAKIEGIVVSLESCRETRPQMIGYWWKEDRKGLVAALDYLKVRTRDQLIEFIEKGTK